MKCPLEIYKKYLLKINEKTLIDVACGKGQYSIIASELGFKVTATDGRVDRVPLKDFLNQELDSCGYKLKEKEAITDNRFFYFYESKQL